MLLLRLGIERIYSSARALTLSIWHITIMRPRGPLFVCGHLQVILNKQDSILPFVYSVIDHG